MWGNSFTYFQCSWQDSDLFLQHYCEKIIRISQNTLFLFQQAANNFQFILANIHLIKWPWQQNIFLRFKLETTTYCTCFTYQYQVFICEWKLWPNVEKYLEFVTLLPNLSFYVCALITMISSDMQWIKHIRMCC